MIKLETLKNGILKENVITESNLRNVSGGDRDTTYGDGELTDFYDGCTGKTHYGPLWNIGDEEDHEIKGKKDIFSQSEELLSLS